MPNKAQQALAGIFEALHICRVVCIDDAYCPRENLEVGELKVWIVDSMMKSDQENLDLLARVFSGVSFDDPKGPWNQILERRFQEADASQKSTWARDLGISVGESRDVGHLRRLTKIMKDIPCVGFSKLTPDEWQKSRDEIISECSDVNRVLCFFDEDLSKVGLPDDAGLTLLAGAVQKWEERGGEMGYFAILSQKFGDSEEPAKLDALPEHLRGGQVLPISKDRLSDPLNFAYSVKLAVMNRSYQRLREELVGITAEAQTNALGELNELSIWDFAHIVLSSSQKEGVWEFESLHRVFSLLERRAHRRCALSRRESLDDDIRLMHSLRGIRTGAEQRPSPKVWSLRHSELFEEPEVVNQYHLQLELGDMFQETSPEPQLYVLVAQPCDLMLRSNKGLRQAVSGTLVPVGSTEDESKSQLRSTGSNPVFDDFKYLRSDGSERTWFLSFAKSFEVSLDVLDLATFHATGECSWGVDDVAPQGLSSPSTGRYFELHERYGQLNNTLLELSGLLEEDESAERYDGLRKQLLSRFSLTAETVDPQHSPGQFRFGWKRVGRLSQPNANNLLRMYFAYRSRFASERDFAAGLSWKEVSPDPVKASAPSNGKQAASPA